MTKSLRFLSVIKINYKLMKKAILLLQFIFFTIGIFAQKAETELSIANYKQYYSQAQKVKDAVKEVSIQKYRQYFFANGYRKHELNDCKFSWQECLAMLTEDGQFKDILIASDKALKDVQLGEAFRRIWKISLAYKDKEFNEMHEKFTVYQKAILFYGAKEIGRSNVSNRFHVSCFLIPTAAVNTYFNMLSTMDDVECGKIQDKQTVAVCDMLKILGLQAWTQPLRNDETDKNVVQIERFRNHVWWVGGNALAYRSLLPVAFMYKSIPMVDLLAEVCQKCISTTSQNTFNDAFWTEGFTADGAGWGHGKQCLIWGYPIDGTSTALAMLNSLKDSPWAKPLTTANTKALLNFFRGANWYYYKGYTLPGLNRVSMWYDMESRPIRYVGMLNTLINEWKDSFTPEEFAELNQLTQEGAKKNINMGTHNIGVYSGTRWFFNNDDLIKKNKNYHIMVNMASVRCDGLESALNVADEYNFFTADGSVLFQKEGNEYRKVMGAWDVTATPGVTAREGMDRLTPVTNWRGYCSKFNFAGAATDGGEHAVGGFIFEKMNGNDKGNVNDRGTENASNTTLYGVRAHKAYFFMGDYFIGLGAGITNSDENLPGSIRTCIDQTAIDGEVQLLINGKVLPVLNGTQSFFKKGKPVWVVQKNKFAYTVLPEFTKNASFVRERRKADWVKMNQENRKIKNLPDTVDMLQLWINHGQKVFNGTYGYVVYAGKSLPTPNLPFTIVRNDTLVQALQSTDRKITGAVFYKANTKLSTKYINVSTSAPCVILIQYKDNQQILTVNDPRMDAELKQIRIELNGKIVQVDMPLGEFCGKPVSIKI